MATREGHTDAYDFGGSSSSSEDGEGEHSLPLQKGARSTTNSANGHSQKEGVPATSRVDAKGISPYLLKPRSRKEKVVPVVAPSPIVEDANKSTDDDEPSDERLNAEDEEMEEGEDEDESEPVSEELPLKRPTKGMKTPRQSYGTKEKRKSTAAGKSPISTDHGDENEATEKTTGETETGGNIGLPGEETLPSKKAKSKYDPNKKKRAPRTAGTKSAKRKAPSRKKEAASETKTTSTTAQTPRKRSRKAAPPVKKNLQTENPLRKGHRFRPGTVALREIRRYQKSTELLIPTLSMNRLIREIMQDVGNHRVDRIQKSAIHAIREATESYLVDVFTHTNDVAIHAKRVTIFPRDMELVLSIRGELKNK